MPRQTVRALTFVLVALFCAGPTTAQERNGDLRPALPTADVIAKLPPDGGPDFNRLIFETSPYLLDHAANPVDWYPWGVEAFDEAFQEDKLIFLFIGYSSCFRCRAMERESFSNTGVGGLLNEHFVSILVDHEEKPDIDEAYRSRFVARRGRAAWPLSLLLTPDRKPFFIASYIPLETRGPLIGIGQLVSETVGIWMNNPWQLDLMAEALSKGR